MMIYDKIQLYEVYWCDLPVVVNGIAGGRRPVIVISNEMTCRYSEYALAVPTTHTIKRTDLPVNVVVNLEGKESMAMCNQVTTIHRTWLRQYIGRLTEKEVRAIKTGILTEIGVL